MHLSVSGKVALITGGSRGIGAAAVRMFVAAGARVLFNYGKSKAQADQLVKELGGDNCAAVCCDLSGTETARELVVGAVEGSGRRKMCLSIRWQIRNGAIPSPSTWMGFLRWLNTPLHK